jgi:hypothetical protein
MIENDSTDCQRGMPQSPRPRARRKPRLAAVQQQRPHNVVSIAPRLAASAGSRETSELLQELARQAQAGEITGAVVIAIRPRALRGKHYFFSLAGAAAGNPTYAAGAMSVCQILLAELAMEDAGIG